MHLVEFQLFFILPSKREFFLYFCVKTVFQMQESPLSDLSGWDGETEAFARIYRKFAPKMRCFVSKLLHDNLLTDDIVHNVFLRLWENREMSKIALRAARKRYRSKDSTFSGYTSIDQILNDARNEYLEKGDIALDEILKGVATKVNTSLTNDINNRQLLINNDPVIHLDMTVDVNNMPVINKVHTLLQEINVKSPSVLPKTKDGEIDTTGIQNVDYSSGNLQDFTVYLQGGQTIKGSIIGSEVNIVDTVMYEVPFDPNREQKLKIFEDTIGDHENLRETSSASTIPMVPTPAAPRYIAAGAPSPPAPMISTFAFKSFFCPFAPTSFNMICLE